MSLVAVVVAVVFAVVVFVFVTNNVRQFSFFLFCCLFSFLSCFVFTLCVGALRKHSSRNDSKKRSTLTRPVKGALPARLSARCVRARESVGVRARERDCVRVCVLPEQGVSCCSQQQFQLLGSRKKQLLVLDCASVVVVVVAAFEL